MRKANEENLKEELVKAQARMKYFADRQRSERKLDGGWRPSVLKTTTRKPLWQ